MTETINAELTLTNKVNNFKVIARNALRMELISPRLSKIADIEASIKELNDCKTRLEHELKVEIYEKSKLDTAHPDYETNKKLADETIEILTKEIEEHTKFAEETAKEIIEQKEGIAKIEAGETKVSLEALNDLVSKMIKQDAYAQVKA